MNTSGKYSFRSYQRTILPPAPPRFNVVRESLRYEINDRPLKDLLLIDNTTVRASRLLKRALVADDFGPSSEGYGVSQLAKVMNVQQLVTTSGLDRDEAHKLFTIRSIDRIVIKEAQMVKPIIRGRDNIFEQYLNMCSLDYKQLINARYMLVFDQTFAIGSSEMLQLSPLEVIEPAILCKVDSVIRTQDHLIIGKDAYASLVVTS